MVEATGPRKGSQGWQTARRYERCYTVSIAASATNATCSLHNILGCCIVVLKPRVILRLAEGFW